MSGERTPGLVFDLNSGPAPGGSADSAWGSLREMGGWWGLLRYLPGAIRQAFTERESVGGLPIVEPGHTRPAELAEVDFDPGALTAEHTPTAETPTSEASAAEVLAAEPLGAEFTAEESLAEAATVEPLAAEPAAAAAVQELIAEPVTADVSEAAVSEAGAELGEAGL